MKNLKLRAKRSNLIYDYLNKKLNILDYKYFLKICINYKI